MSNHQVRIFNAFDMQSNPYIADHAEIQDVIDYCECRFRVILIAFSKADEQHRVHIQSGLLQELTFALSYVGMAAAIGRSIQIPVIVRSLAKDFYVQAGQNQPISLDLEFLLALDAGISHSGTSVDDYECAWWRMKGPPAKKSILGSANVRKCLAFHRDHCKHTAGNASEMTKPNYIWKHSAGDRDGICTRCRLYRAVALGTLDELQDIRHLVHGMEVSLAAKQELTMRRASGFNQLYEFLVIKELDAAATTTFFDEVPRPISAPELHEESLSPVSKSKRASRPNKKLAARRKAAEDVQRGAIAEVARLENLPSLKWTWGAVLEPSDLKALVRSADKGMELPHSDYDSSLPFGRNSRTWSPEVSVQGDYAGIYSEIGSDVQSIPDLDEDSYPHMFDERIRKKRGVYLSSLGHAAQSGVVTAPRLEGLAAVPRPERSQSGWLPKPLDDYVQPPALHLGLVPHSKGIVDNESDALDIDDMYVSHPAPAGNMSATMMDLTTLPSSSSDTTDASAAAAANAFLKDQVAVSPSSNRLPNLSPSDSSDDFPGLVGQATDAFLRACSGTAKDEISDEDSEGNDGASAAAAAAAWMFGSQIASQDPSSSSSASAEAALAAYCPLLPGLSRSTSVSPNRFLHPASAASPGLLSDLPPFIQADTSDADDESSDDESSGTSDNGAAAAAYIGDLFNIQTSIHGPYTADDFSHVPDDILE